MKKKIRIIGIIAFLLFLIAVTTAINIMISTSSFFESLNNIAGLTIGILSVIISGMALVIALVTYTSIDSVNSISSMEGNILENSNYTMAYYEMVMQYRQCRTSDDFQQEVLSNINHQALCNADTCKGFTNVLQSVIDHIIWFSYIDIQEVECQEKVKLLLDKLDKRFIKLNTLSNGNQYLLHEHLKLIKYVLFYQSNRHHVDYLADCGELINIRGRLLINPVSQTVYYDYLGLEYRSKLVRLLRNHCGFTGDEYLVENMIVVQNTALDLSVLDEIGFYVEKAYAALHKAASLSENDMLWDGYIKFNLARVAMLETVIFKKGQDRWEQYISDAIHARRGLLYLFANSDECSTSFLFGQFVKELYYAETLQLVYKALNQLLTEQDTARVVEIMEFTRQQDRTIYSRVNLYCCSIMNQIG